MTNKLYKNWLNIQDKEINAKLTQMSEEEVQKRFSGILSFGTAGLRGKMELGTNRINEVNVCKLAFAILKYFKSKNLKRIVIGFDTRHNSKEYSRIFARVLAHGGIKVNLYKNFVPTPVLIYSIKETNSNMGIMITASHNQKMYNGIKVSGSDGIQISGDVEKCINDLYAKTDEVKAYNEYLSGICKQSKNITYVNKEIKNKFLGEFYKNKINADFEL